MSMFGINIEIDTRLKLPQDLQDKLLSELLKRKDERVIFKKFLDPVFDSIYADAQIYVKKDLGKGVNVQQNTLEEFTRNKLKETKVGNSNIYQEIINKIILQLDPKAQKSDPFSNPLYPRLHKKAVGLLDAKIKDGIDANTANRYLVEQRTRQTVHQLVREMLTAINKFELNENQLIRYLNVLYQLNNLEIAGPINETDFKKLLAEAIKANTALNLCHIKCLRFIYPKEGGIQILTNTDDKIVDGILGKYSPKSEKRLFSRLLNIKQIFGSNDVPVDFTIILADEDLELLFPQSTQYLTEDQRAEAQGNINKYLTFLTNRYQSEFAFYRLTDLINSTKNYQTFRKQILNDISRSGGKYVNPNFFEKDRVDHQYTYYQQLFGPSYSRAEARRSISEQTASTIALKEVLDEHFSGCVLIEENRGGENKLIANGSVPIKFVQLRDEAKFDLT